jgi:hypothetical protein
VPDIKLSSVSRLDPFDFRWPEDMEAFEGGWAYTAEIGGTHHAVRHGVGARTVYGRIRVHSAQVVDVCSIYNARNEIVDRGQFLAE